MPYVLGIDLGHSRTSAAVCRHVDGSWTDPEVAPLNGGTGWVESALQMSPDGTVLAGQDIAHPDSAPERTVRDLLHRVGDPVPIVVGTQAYPGDVLTAALAGWISDQLAYSFGEPAAQLALTHPPGWGPHRRRVLHEALAAAGLPGAVVLPAPIAAAECHAADERVEAGNVLAVCRLGGERVESALLRRGQPGFELLAHAAGPDPNGGTVIDDLLIEHVLDGLDSVPDDPRLRAWLRIGCARAKESLSEQPEARVPLPAGGGVPITRRELDHIAEPVLRAAAHQLTRLAARVPSAELAAVVLTGGTARMPLATTLAEATLRRYGVDCPVRVGADPAGAECAGAALIARRRVAAEPEPAAPVGADNTPLPVRSATAGEVDQGEIDIGPPPPRPPVEITPLEPPRQFAALRIGSRGGDRGADRDGDGR